MMNQLAAEVREKLPLTVTETLYEDPMLTLVGTAWGLNLLCPWRVTRGSEVVVDWEVSDVEQLRQQFVGDSIVDVSGASASDQADPVFRFGSGLELRVMADTDVDPWVLRVAGMVFVGWQGAAE